MPIGATEPIFSKFINDTKASEAAVLNYLAGKVGLSKDDVVLDKFRVVAAPKSHTSSKAKPMRPMYSFLLLQVQVPTLVYLFQ